jgi:phosphonate degradation associated HDIG domain protein
MHAADSILAALAAGNARGYIGEPVSQLEHALQCAALARRANAEPAVVLAALFHDIGHLVAPDGSPTLDEFGIADHESIGADWLLAHGFSPAVAEPVREHVRAKRYLCARYPHYHERLSDASRETLARQGGPMNDAEMAAFTARPDLAAILAVRAWDDQAKDVDAEIPDLASYREMLVAHLESSHAD